MRNEKRSWQENKLNNCDQNSGQTWKYVKGWLNWKSSGSPTQLFHDGILVQKPKVIAEVMNSFFIEKINKLKNSLPNSISDPLANVKKLMRNKNCIFKLKSVHPDTIEEIIKTLKKSKSSGLDYIDTYIIKLAKNEILPALTHIANLSIEQCVFPEKFKNSKVIPLHKKEDLLNPKNYRPVSILPIMSKILERVIYIQIIRYLEENKILNASHHGFRSNHSCTTALIQMYDQWMETLENNEYSGICLLDMSAAFDMVKHDLLIEKLEIYGLDKNSIDWITSYLTNRKQCVSIDGVFSRFLDVTIGVPQGSILGPIFYIIYTNDLPEIVHDHVLQDDSKKNFYCDDCGGICCFADDSTYSCSGKTHEILIEKLTVNYEKISEYKQVKVKWRQNSSDGNDDISSKKIDTKFQTFSKY